MNLPQAEPVLSNPDLTSDELLSSLDIGVAVNTIADGKAVYMNEQFEKIYGWTIEGIPDVESFFLKVYPDEQEREAIRKRITEDISSGDPKRMIWQNVQITTKSGEKKVVNALNMPLEKHGLMVSTVIDVTRLALIVKKHKSELEGAYKELQEKVKELERMNKIMVGRELAMAELKQKVKDAAGVSSQEDK